MPSRVQDVVERSPRARPRVVLARYVCEHSDCTGGTVDVETNPTGGTILRWCVPVK